MKMAISEQSYDELLEMLSEGDIAQKQISVLKLEEIKSSDDAKLLVSRLINQDGKVREAVSFKINKLIKNTKFTNFFMQKENYDIFLQSITDINGNICRNVVETTAFLADNDEFSSYFSKNLIKKISEIWESIEKLDLTAKQYTISKRNFQLYWGLEALSNFTCFVKTEDLKKILLKCGTFYDYTIREKVAKIFGKIEIEDAELLAMRENLKNDENYFVRNIL